MADQPGSHDQSTVVRISSTQYVPVDGRSRDPARGAVHVWTPATSAHLVAGDEAGGGRGIKKAAPAPLGFSGSNAVLAGAMSRVARDDGRFRSRR
jgi:hypothetical protein